MTWMTNENSPNTELKPMWQYRDGMDFVTVLPNTSRDFILIQGDADPTRTWNGPLSVWVHEFKAQKGGFATIICNKWNEACPYCFENEIYKQDNPNYKNTGGRLPYGLSNKALIQVYDIQLGKILWLLAGKQIQDGMNFLLQNKMHQFKNCITISRIGERLNTNYRVDLYHGDMVDYAQHYSNIIPIGGVNDLIFLSHQELYEKSGINPYMYFKNMDANKLGRVDISNWGMVPMEDKCQASAPTSQPLPQTQPQTQQPMPTNQTNTNGELSKELSDALEFVCQSGIYVNQKIKDVVIQTGKPYIQFLSRSGSPEEKAAATVILNTWNLVQQYIDNSVPF